MSTVDRRWKRTIHLKDLLGPEDDDETVRDTAAVVARRLKRFQARIDGSARLDLIDIVEELEDIAAGDDGEYTDRWTRCRHFNDVLDSFYDWADAYRVWVA